MNGSQRLFLASVMVVGMAGLGSSAQAQSPEPLFGEPGHVALSAERLFGYAHGSETQSLNGVEGNSTTVNGISILGSPLSAVPLTSPRVGFDAFVARAVSLGASLTIFHFSQSTTTPAGSGNAVDLSATGFIFAPRIGFAARLSPAAALWLRGGVTYLRLSTEPTAGGMSLGTSTLSLFALTIEAPLVVRLTPRTAILVGPTLDLGLSGSNTTNPPANSGGTSAKIDEKETEFGLQVGLSVLL